MADRISIFVWNNHNDMHANGAHETLSKEMQWCVYMAMLLLLVQWNTPPQTCIECPLEVSQKSDKANYMYSSDQQQPIVATVWRNSVRESILQCVWDGSLQLESTNTTINVCCQAPTCSGLNHSPLPQRRSYRTTHNILYKWVRNRWTFVSAKAEKLPQRRHFCSGLYHL